MPSIPLRSSQAGLRIADDAFSHRCVLLPAGPVTCHHSNAPHASQPRVPPVAPSPPESCFPLNCCSVPISHYFVLHDILHF